MEYFEYDILCLGKFLTGNNFVWVKFITVSRISIYRAQLKHLQRLKGLLLNKINKNISLLIVGSWQIYVRLHRLSNFALSHADIV